MSQKHYVKHPIEITSQIIDSAKMNDLICAEQMQIGKYICVNVLDNGYQIPEASVIFDTKELAQKACNAHNSWLGYNELQSAKIVSQSINASLKINQMLQPFGHE